MDRALKQRLIGAAVLIAIAVIFLPMLVKGPAPVSGAADVSIEVPAEPNSGFETRELPLGVPGQVPAGGVAGMANEAPVETPSPAPSTPATAAGDYAVNFGHYGTSADADRMASALNQSQLTAYSEAAKFNGRDAWRVRIGPFASRAEAEAARLRALHVSDKVNASVAALNADAQAPATVATTSTSALPPAVATAPLPATPAPAAKPTVTQPAPSQPTPVAAAKPAEPAPKPVAVAPKPTQPVAAEPKPAPKPAAPAAKPATSNVGFAVQLGAFADADAAKALRDKARAAGLSAFTETVNTDDGPRTRVRVGPVADRADAEKLRAQAQSRLGVGGMVRPHP